MAHPAETADIAMELADIPGTSLKVSRVAIGTWAIGGWMWGGTDEAESVSTIRAALEHGINVIDTAPVYGFGRSEEIVGKAIAEGRLRSRVLIATKAGLEWRDGKVFRNASRDRIMREIEDSLRRLRTDHIDIYQVHWPDPSGPDRRNRGGDAHAVQSRERSAPSASATFRSTRWSNSAASRRSTCCSRPIICSSAKSRPISCPIAAKTRSRRSAMARCAGACCPGGCGRIRISMATICAAPTRNSSSRGSRNILPPCNGSIGSRRNVSANASFTWRSAGCSIKASPRRCGARAIPVNCEPVDEVTGWWLDASAKAEIDRILRESVSDPVGPEFMAPPARPRTAQRAEVDS